MVKVNTQFLDWNLSEVELETAALINPTLKCRLYKNHALSVVDSIKGVL